MNTRTSVSPSSLWYLSFFALLAFTCRDYDSGAPDAFNGGGAPTGGGAHGGEAGESGDGNGGASGSLQGGAGGASGDGGQSGESGDGGRSGNATGGRSGSGGTGAATSGAGSGGRGGESGDGASGDGGDGSGPNTPPLPGILGAVRLLANGAPQCGGSLITNEWVLTADQCVTTEDVTSLEIGFGLDTERFQQTRRVIEIRRFPGNDGTDANRVRDLLLLGVERPFEIDGQTSGYYRPLWHMGPEHLVATHRCVGWDLRVSTDSPTSKLVEAPVTAFAFDWQARGGNRIWWLNTSANADDGVLPMQADVGSPCFYNFYESIVQTTVHSGNPKNRLDGRENPGREAYSTALGDTAMREWIDTELYDTVIEEIVLAGSPAACAPSRDRIELFGVREDGSMGWSTWEGTWRERAPLFSPTNGASFSLHAPGAYCTTTGSIWVVAAANDRAIYWQHMEPGGQWNNDWQRLEGVTTQVESGVAVAGVLPDHFYVFAGNATGLHYAEYDDDWTGEWTALGGGVVGTPTARMAHEGRIDVFVRGDDLHVYQKWMQAGEWMDWVGSHGPVYSEPAVVGFSFAHQDVLARTSSGTLGHRFSRVTWADVHGSDVPMPLGTPAVVARQPGHVDLFVTQPDGRVWHAFSPRPPRSERP